MKNTLIALSILSIFLASCSKEKDPFLITADAIGPLTKEVKVSQLDSVFTQDSLVYLGAESNMFTKSEQIEVYEKGGKKLLLLSPKNAKNPDSKITHIQLFDDRYKTEKGIHLNSTFKEIKDNYTIKSILNTMRSVIVSLDETDVYITIDKANLPAFLSEPGIEIQATDIPDQTKFKFFMLDWE